MLCQCLQPPSILEGGTVIDSARKAVEYSNPFGEMSVAQCCTVAEDRK